MKARKMKIAVMSDSHDRWDYLEKAIDLAEKEGCTNLLFAGDLVAPPGIAVLNEFNGEVKFVWGNNEGEKMGMTRKFDASEKIELCGDVFEGKIGGAIIYMNHYPRNAENAFKSGDYDMCICGHTHEYRVENNKKCVLLNPGEIQGYVTGKSTFAIFDTVSKQVTKITI